MKNWWKATGLAAAGAMMLAGCSGTDGGSGSGGEDGETTLTAWAWNVNVGALEDAMALYQEENPDVKIEVEDIGRLDVYDKLSTGLAAGGVGLPDIVLVEDDRIGGYAQAFPDGFLNLSEKGFEDNADQFPSFKQDLATVNDSFYAMPFDAGPGGMFYRRSIFEEASVNPEDIETWDDFLEAGKKIKEATGVAAMPLDKFNDDPTFRMMLNQLGTYYFDENGNIDLTSPEAVMAMEKQMAFEEADLIKEVDGWNGTVSATIDGSVATIPFGAWYYGTIIDQAKDTSGDWGVFLLPAFEEGGNRASNLGGSSWMIPSGGDNEDAAYDFLEFFSTSPEAQVIAMEDYGLFPSLNAAYEEEVFTSEDEFFGGQKIWELFADEMADVETPYYTEDYALGLDEAIKAQADSFNGTDPAEALKAAAERLAERTDREINN
ncbi:ABC transporter substrate-binding protein [Jeotgalibacillus campisalis]|uniref:L-arabinose ABC transporter L-arabinose-binding protein AraN n=1 Tax=Jeotgalibacillus campisalis TaxID=220754 RepID=A0A0C2VFB2_9BACL|nr:sugar ABC transporter substrate-binding protein [Jeotgalibacillus campisalis]KIL43221.1 L-arabinose ABC transporter L-arabinose-binding protein AraN [Jeotgalibacillus campisalis]